MRIDSTHGAVSAERLLAYSWLRHRQRSFSAFLYQRTMSTLPDEDETVIEKGPDALATAGSGTVTLTLEDQQPTVEELVQRALAKPNASGGPTSDSPDDGGKRHSIE